MDDINSQPESNKVAGSGTLEIDNEGKALTVDNNVAFDDEEYIAQFSIFTKGYVNKRGQTVLQTVPYRITTLKKVHAYITGRYAMKATEHLRQITDKDEAGNFKKLNFCFATFSGIFRYRRASELVQHSRLMVLDFDEPEIREAFPEMDIEDALVKLKQRLLDDETFETELLFRSPSGHGLKWVIYVGTMQGMHHKDYFRCVSDYISKNIGVHVDESGKDVNRACFLPYDPECYINPELV